MPKQTEINPIATTADNCLNYLLKNTLSEKLNTFVSIIRIKLPLCSKIAASLIITSIKITKQTQKCDINYKTSYTNETNFLINIAIF